MWSLNPFNWFRKKPQRRRSYPTARSYGSAISSTTRAVASDATIVEGIGSGIGSVAFGDKHTNSHGPVYSSPISDDDVPRKRKEYDHAPFIVPMPLEAPSHDHGHSHSHDSGSSDCGSSSCDSGGGGCDGGGGGGD